MEGFVRIRPGKEVTVRRAVEKMPRPRQTRVKKALARDMKKREAGKSSACPFLKKNHACMVYAVCPFACRRVYSLHVCTPANPPRLHSQVMERAAETVTALQRQDINGYTGHLSYILHMLDAPRFMRTYLAGESKPE